LAAIGQFVIFCHVDIDIDKAIYSGRREKHGAKDEHLELAGEGREDAAPAENVEDGLLQDVRDNWVAANEPGT
jgi:hypothetical protein